MVLWEYTCKTLGAFNWAWLGNVSSWRQNIVRTFCIRPVPEVNSSHNIPEEVCRINAVRFFRNILTWIHFQYQSNTKSLNYVLPSGREFPVKPSRMHPMSGAFKLRYTLISGRILPIHVFNYTKYILKDSHITVVQRKALLLLLWVTITIISHSPESITPF